MPYRTSMGFYGEYYQKKYDAVEPGFTVLRDDRTTTLSATAGISFTDRYGLYVVYVYMKNDSSIPELEYTRSITSATLTARF
jgi:predicted porin